MQKKLFRRQGIYHCNSTSDQSKKKGSKAVLCYCQLIIFLIPSKMPQMSTVFSCQMHTECWTWHTYSLFFRRQKKESVGVEDRSVRIWESITVLYRTKTFRPRCVCVCVHTHTFNHIITHHFFLSTVATIWKKYTSSPFLSCFFFFLLVSFSLSVLSPIYLSQWKASVSSKACHSR